MKTPRFFHSSACLIFFIILLTFSAYAFMLGGSFKTLDDDVAIINNPLIKSFSHVGEIFRSSFFGGNAYYRPLISFSHLLEHHFFGLDPFYFNLTNLILHILNTIGVFFLVSWILKDKPSAFGVAGLFAIHPVQWEAVSNIAGRSILLCAFFYIYAFLFFYLFTLGRNRIFCYVLSLIFFGLSLLSKESAVVFPLVVGLWLAQRVTRRRGPPSFCFDFAKQNEAAGVPQGQRFDFAHHPSRTILSKVEGDPLGPHGLWVIPFFGVTAGYLLLRAILGITRIFWWPSFRELLLGVITFFRSLFTHLNILVSPVDLYFDRSQPIFQSFSSPELILTVVALIAAAGFFLSGRRRINANTWFFLGWFLIALIPVSQIVPVLTQPGSIAAADHFLYIPSAGIFAAAVIFLKGIYQEARRRGILSKGVFSFWVAGFYTFLFLTTVQQTIYASQEIAMFEQSLRVNPGNLRVRTSLGLAFAKKRLFKEAEGEFRKVLAADPGDVRARIGLGKALCDQGKFWDGIREYEKIWDAGPSQELLVDNLKRTYGILLERYLALRERDPRNPRIYYSLGVVYSKMDHPHQAIGHYEKAVELDPDFKNALFNLASSLEAVGDWEAAVGYYQRVLALGKTEDTTTPLDEYALRHLVLVQERLRLKQHPDDPK